MKNKFDIITLVFLFFSSFCLCQEVNKIALKNKNFIYGVNGHPLTDIDYQKIGISNQLNLISKLNLTAYRIDIFLKKEILHNEEIRIDSLNNIAYAKKITILPIIFTNRLFDLKKSAEENYQLGIEAAKLFLEYFPKCNYVELGNENDASYNPSLYDKVHDELNKNDQDFNRFELENSVIKGFTNYIKKQKTEIKTIIDTRNYETWYLKAIYKDGVNFDIIGSHIYSTKDLIVSLINPNSKYKQVLDDIYNYFMRKKFIWITEYNYVNDNIGVKKNIVINIHQQFMKEALKVPYIKALLYYELLDQPSVKEKNKNSPEHFFGIYKYYSK